jgi:hypothetical protein
MRQDHNREKGGKNIVQERGDLDRQRHASSQARGESQRGKEQVSLFSALY